MRDYLGTMKNDSVLLGQVDRYLRNLPNDRDMMVIHPSEMVDPDWCPRATWHRLMGHRAKEKVHPLRMQLIFAEGNAVHSRWQRWARSMGVLYGKWECTTCGLSLFGWSSELDAEACPTMLNGASHHWEYREVPLTDSDRLIAGHADGIVKDEKGELWLLEVKSIGPGTLRRLKLVDDDDDYDDIPGKFKKITRPLPSHFRQTQVYLRLARKNYPYLDLQGKGLILYEQKADGQVREFRITADDRWTDDIFDMAEDVCWSVASGDGVACIHDSCAQCRAYEED